MPEVKDYNLYTRISRAINYSFGTTGPGAARVSTQKVDLLPVDETVLRARYMSIVAFSSNDMFEQLMRKHRQEGVSMIEAALEKAKENYESMFSDEKAGEIVTTTDTDKTDKKTINFDINMDSIKDDVEFTYFIQGTPVKRGFFRLNCLVNIK